MIFDTLNKAPEARQKNLDDQLRQFPYVDGGLFHERLETAAFNSEMRRILLKCCTLDWSQIKPEIFGAMFQSIKDKDKRRALGEHYTSETNILKLIRPLFLDNLRADFESIKKTGIRERKHNLIKFHDRLCKLKFLDPACGCGNFLVVSYRELRLLEIEVLKEILGLEKVLDIELMIRVNVNQFYGIEIEEFPARIAQTALWLMDHLMNNRASAEFGKYIVRIPLTASPSIVIGNGNALTLDWESIAPSAELSYILGNPPFLGSRVMNAAQKTEVRRIFDTVRGSGELDYVTCWYKKAACYIKKTKIECAFVSTNSICQGLQVPILWPLLMNNYGIKINFAHQTFKWSNEARGKAAVCCVIIGFSLVDRKDKKLFLYETITGKPVENSVNQINAYLIDAPMIFIERRNTPLCEAPEMNFGNMPADGGEFLFTGKEKAAFIALEPKAAPYFKRFISAREFINNGERWCLWLADIEPAKLKSLKQVYKRVSNVRKIREQSARPELAKFPHLFAQITQPKGKGFILIPSTTSENRYYIPMGFFKKNNISANSCHIIPDAGLYHFGILTSAMHMAWTRYVCGRLKSDYRYSKEIVYNNFPWPSEPAKQKEENAEDRDRDARRKREDKETKETRAARIAKEKLEEKTIKEFEKNKTAIEAAAQTVLDARALFPRSSLADLYDPLTMPPELVNAHLKLDKAVDRAYGRTFDNDAQRVAYLFELYQKLSGELFMEVKKRGKGRKV
jgi:hypothetical protein